MHTVKYLEKETMYLNKRKQEVKYYILATTCFRTGVEKGMKLCTAVQESCGYKDTLRAHRYFDPLAKYFTVCISYQPANV